MGEFRGDTTTTLVVPDNSAPESSDDDQMLLIVMSGSAVGQIFPLSRDKPVTVIGRDDLSDIQVLDAEISRRHAALRYDRKAGCFFLGDLRSRNGTTVNGEPVDGEQRLEVGEKFRLGESTVIRLSLASEPEARYARKMYHAALRDGLTGVFNRRYLDERLASEVAYALRHRAALAVLMVDIDRFKAINDSHGHRAGDAVLQQFADLLIEHVRTEDVVVRYGGEEFAVLCRDTNEESASILAERLRAGAADASFSFEGISIPISVSIGVAGMLELGVTAPQNLIEAADKALYQAKNGGRNRWCLASKVL